MYSNCELYTNNQAGNMVARENMSEISNGNNNDHKMKNFGKINQDISESSSGGYKEQDYLNFGQSSVEFSSENMEGSEDQSSKCTNNDYSCDTTQGFDFVSTETSKNPTSDTQSGDSNPTKLDIKTEDELSNSPFTRDMNGILSPIGINGRIVYSDMSIEEANLCLKNGPDPAQVHYECPYCNILMAHPKRFLIHVKWHSFGLTNKRRMDLMKDIEQSRTERRKARTMERLLKNEAKDESEANYPCKDCDKVFITKGSLKRHRFRSHPGPRARAPCALCGAEAGGAAELRAHMASHRGPRDQLYACPDCPKKYKFPHSLVKHMDTHLEKTHPCSICPKLFGSEKQLARHLKLHEKFSREPTCHCAYCGKGYYDSFTLQIHERNHTQEKPFPCEICNTAFSTNSSLQRHLKVSHSSSKPHVCASCGRSFSSSRTRDRHALRAHADPALRPYGCTLCDGRYFKPKDLRNHMYKAHPRSRGDGD